MTQLFTERYMVRFLLHNTVGAWWAGKVLAAAPALASSAPDEAALRKRMRLGSGGGYDFDYLRFVRARAEADEVTSGPVPGVRRRDRSRIGPGRLATFAFSIRAAGAGISWSKRSSFWCGCAWRRRDLRIRCRPSRAVRQHLRP